jgi:hypothetical protein
VSVNGGETLINQAFSLLVTPSVQLLFSQGFQEERDSEALLLTADRALFGICLFSACRIREACISRNALNNERIGPLQESLLKRRV